MKRLAALLVLVGSAIAGCYVAAYDPYYYGSPYYNPYYYGYDVYFAFGWALSAPPSSTASQAVIDLNASANAIASAAGTYFTPSGCATATASGPTVQYAFTNCEGQFGARTFSGKTTLVLSEDSGNLVMTATSSDFVADGRPFVLDFTATTTQIGNQRVATIDSRTHQPDQVDARQEKGTVSWLQGGDCVEVSGQGSSTRGPLSATSTVRAYQRCATHCPTAGDVVVQSSEGTFAAHFDGSPSMLVVAPDGKQKTFDLKCQ